MKKPFGLMVTTFVLCVLATINFTDVMAFNAIPASPLGIPSYNSTLAINPKNTGALIGIGDIYSNQGNYTEARQYYNKALTIDPNNTYALIGIGKTFSKQANYTEAIQYYNKYTRIFK